jgi:hypothetical protein
MRTPDVELRWWPGCPSTERALADLQAALDELRLDQVDVRMTEIRTDQDAEDVRFVGSPSIMVDGTDIVPAADREPIGLSCRVYQHRDGRISPTPDPHDLRAALRRAAAA